MEVRFIGSVHSRLASVDNIHRSTEELSASRQQKRAMQRKRKMSPEFKMSNKLRTKNSNTSKSIMKTALSYLTLTSLLLPQMFINCQTSTRSSDNQGKSPIWISGNTDVLRVVLSFSEPESRSSGSFFPQPLSAALCNG